MPDAPFRDVSKIVDVPVTILLLTFECPSCKFQKNFYFFTDKHAAENFGTCPKCTAKMFPIKASIDVTKLFALIGSQLNIPIGFKIKETESKPEKIENDGFHEKDIIEREAILGRRLLGNEQYSTESFPDVSKKSESFHVPKKNKQKKLL